MGKYNKGDKVRIKSLDWYNENKDRYGSVECGFYCFTKEMSVHCGQIMTISDKLNSGIMKMENDSHFWTNQMIESLAGEELYKWYPIKDDGEYWTDYDLCIKDEVYCENITRVATVVTDGTSLYTYNICPYGWGQMAKHGNWRYMRIKLN